MNTDEDLLPIYGSDPDQADLIRQKQLQNLKGIRGAGADRAYRQDYDTARKTGITKEDLDALTEHEGINNVVKAFISMAGAANRVDPTQANSLVDSATSTHRNNINSRQALAESLMKRAIQGQELNKNELNDVLTRQKAERGISSDVQANQNVDPAIRAQMNTINKHFGLAELPEFVPQAVQKETLDLNKDALTKQIERQHYNQVAANEHERNMLMGYQVVEGIDPATGKPTQFVVNKPHGTDKPLFEAYNPATARFRQSIGAGFKKDIKNPQFNAVEAHTSVQNYNHADDNLDPHEKAEADQIFRTQLADLGGKFDKGAKNNIFTNTMQLLTSFDKANNTGAFDTPQNPAIGKAAFQKLRSAVDFALLGEGGSARPGMFHTQFNMGTSFGGAGTDFTEGNLIRPVPTEKIENLKNRVAQKIGGAIKVGLTGIDDRAQGEAVARDLFGENLDDYLRAYQTHDIPSEAKASQLQTHSTQGAPRIRHIEELERERGIK